MAAYVFFCLSTAVAGQEMGRETVMGTEAVELERVRHDAILVIIRLGLGGYELKGPGRNVLEPESRVVWATVANELAGEGYAMVTPEEYAQACDLSREEVQEQVWVGGNLFALWYGDETLLSLPIKEAMLPVIEGN